MELHPTFKEYDTETNLLDMAKKCFEQPWSELATTSSTLLVIGDSDDQVTSEISTEEEEAEKKEKRVYAGSMRYRVKERSDLVSCLKATITPVVPRDIENWSAHNVSHWFERYIPQSELRDKLIKFLYQQAVNGLDFVDTQDRYEFVTQGIGLSLGDHKCETDNELVSFRDTVMKTWDTFVESPFIPASKSWCPENKVELIEMDYYQAALHQTKPLSSSTVIVLCLPLAYAEIQGDCAEIDEDKWVPMALERLDMVANRCRWSPVPYPLIVVMTHSRPMRVYPKYPSLKRVQQVMEKVIRNYIWPKGPFWLQSATTDLPSMLNPSTDQIQNAIFDLDFNNPVTMLRLPQLAFRATRLAARLSKHFCFPTDQVCDLHSIEVQLRRYQLEQKAQSDMFVAPLKHKQCSYVVTTNPIARHIHSTMVSLQKQGLAMRLFTPNQYIALPLIPQYNPLAIKHMISIMDPTAIEHRFGRRCIPILNRCRFRETVLKPLTIVSSLLPLIMKTSWFSNCRKVYLDQDQLILNFSKNMVVFEGCKLGSLDVVVYSHDETEAYQLLDTMYGHAMQAILQHDESVYLDHCTLCCVKGHDYGDRHITNHGALDVVVDPKTNKITTASLSPEEFRNCPKHHAPIYLGVSKSQLDQTANEYGISRVLVELQRLRGQDDIIERVLRDCPHISRPGLLVCDDNWQLLPVCEYSAGVHVCSDNQPYRLSLREFLVTASYLAYILETTHDYMKLKGSKRVLQTAKEHGRGDNSFMLAEEDKIKCLTKSGAMRGRDNIDLELKAIENDFQRCLHALESYKNWHATGNFTLDYLERAIAMCELSRYIRPWLERSSLKLVKLASGNDVWLCPRHLQ